MMTGERLHRLVCALGVPEEHVIRIDPTPKHHAQNAEILRRAIDHHGLSVVIACRPCIQSRARAVKAGETGAPVGAS